MKQQAPTIEWQVIEDEGAWARVCATPLPDRVPPLQGWHGRHCSGVITVVLFLLLGAGGWSWRINQGGLQLTKAETSVSPSNTTTVHAGSAHLAPSATRHASARDWWLHPEPETSKVRAAIQSSEPASSLDIVVETVEVQGDQAVARIVMTTLEGVPAYRQTRFYHRLTTGWSQTLPHVNLWGPERSLETPYFVYQFRQQDAPVVIAAAPQVDELYTRIKSNLGLPISTLTEKLVIDVRVTQPPGQAAPSLPEGGRLIVPSPAVYWAPVELTDAELLLQSIALPLIEQSVAQASKRHAIGAAWQPLLRGLSLWQLWDLDLPLATWRVDVVQWIYIDMPSFGAEHSSLLPDHYAALCAAHKLWMTSPMQLEIPLLCAKPRWEEQNLWRLHHPLLHLEELAPLVPSDEYVGQSSNPDWANHPAQAVALATLIEYVVATCDRDCLPVLVAGLGQYESWETLIPAVYGGSAAEFETGWQAYLAAQYGKSEFTR
jgi:hypothetical protein